MSVNPGFGGQRFIPVALSKIRSLGEAREKRGLSFAIEVDGGVSASTLPDLLAAGADWFVAGSAVFQAEDPAASAKALAEMIHA